LSIAKHCDWTILVFAEKKIDCGNMSKFLLNTTSYQFGGKRRTESPTGEGQFREQKERKEKYNRSKVMCSVMKLEEKTLHKKHDLKICKS